VSSFEPAELKVEELFNWRASRPADSKFVAWMVVELSSAKLDCGPIAAASPPSGKLNRAELGTGSKVEEGAIVDIGQELAEVALEGARLEPMGGS